MKRLIRCALLAAALLPATRSLALEGDEFLPEDYGAVVNDGANDRTAIQAALDAAGAAGGGTVRLSAGVYDVQMVVSRGLGPVNGYSGGPSAYQGVVVPENCRLAGGGMTVSTLRFRAIPNTSPSTIGVGIVNGGYQTALTDFGAGGGIRIEDLRVETPDVTYGHTANLVGLAHADGVTISRVFFGASKAHALEINKSRNITVEDCDFDGQHYGSATLQLDIGYFGAQSLRPTGTVISDVLVQRCHFHGRQGDTLGGEVIELGHTNSTCIVRNVAFEDCVIESLSHPISVAIGNDTPPAQEISGLRLERCHFIGRMESPSVNGLVALTLQGNQLLQDVTVRGCRFSGAYYQGLVIITGYATQNGGWDHRRNILIEDNQFTTTLDRSVPYSSGYVRMLSAGACRDVTIRRNLFEVPATAVNHTLSGGVICCQTANNIDLRLEDNVFAWSHTSAATAPLGASRHTGILNSVWAMEQTGVKSTTQLNRNTFLYPPNGIGSAIRMSTEIPTTSWSPNGFWVGGSIAGNYASGFATSPAWAIQHDLSGAGNIGEIKPTDSSRTAAGGWYACNGAALTSLDAGNHRLARVNAVKCGYPTHLPSLPGEVIRLHGPLRGEGLLADALASYNGSRYRGIHDSLAELCSLPFLSLTGGDLRVVRRPLSVFRWDAGAQPDTAGFASCAPGDKPFDSPGLWILLHCGQACLRDSDDVDGDGLTTIEETALLRDPAVSEPPPSFDFSAPAAAGDVSFGFRCMTGPHTPRIRLLSSENLTHWGVETVCPPGGSFQSPAEGLITEVPSKMGRLVTLSTPGQTRRFWRLSFEP